VAQTCPETSFILQTNTIAYQRKREEVERRKRKRGGRVGEEEGERRKTGEEEEERGKRLKEEEERRGEVEVGYRDYFDSFHDYGQGSINSYTVRLYRSIGPL
jgi:hypothetical protein